MGTALSELLAQAAYGKSAWKLACRTVATANVTLSGLQTIGGVALAVGDRVLVTGQTNAAQNGPYTVSSGAWSRGVDFDAASDVQYGSRFAITYGTAAGQVWTMSSPTSGPIALGATLLTFSQIVTGSSWPGNAPAALDANHIYAYDCAETSGTTLANLGSGANGTMTISGNAYLGSKFLAKSQSSVRFFAENPTDGASTGTSCSMSTATGFSIEAYVASDLNDKFGHVLSIDDGTNQNGILIAHYFTLAGTQAFWTVAVFRNGSVIDTSANQSNKVQPRAGTHLLATYEYGVGMKLFVNGLLAATNTIVTGSLGTMARMTMGIDRAFGQSNFRGYISQVRFSNIPRNASYALSRAENCFGL